jgi:hypothetical protein
MDKCATDKAASSEGFIVEIDGRFDSKYGSITAALNAGLTLKHKDGEHEVRVYEAKERAIG